MRKLLANSHEGRYSYHLADDLYVYQRDERDGAWIGWLCHLSAWDATFSRSAWITMAEVA